MSLLLIVSLLGVFASVAMVVALALAGALSWSDPGRKRLRNMAPILRDAPWRDDAQLAEAPTGALRLDRILPKSQKELGRLRRHLASAGYHQLRAAVVFSTAKLLCPILGGLVPLAVLGTREGWLIAASGATAGYFLPDLLLLRKIRLRATAIENGLPDALDLLLLCIGAGSSLDGSIVKASDELALTHPALAEEFRLLTTEIRAGRPRVEAFNNLATRVRVPDLRALTSMLTQTDRFGTSLSQALRVHADTVRTKRRQRAEERAAKVAVKLVFPLVLCIFPSVYIVCLGPVIVALSRAFA
jgi:tight adherence protein C